MSAMKPHLTTASDPLHHARAVLELRSVLARLQLAAIQLQWGISELAAGHLSQAGAHMVLDEALAELSGWAP
jgi:hypothetical protein